MKAAILATIDKGWFGLTPLETHVVVCGFPRSGSTLLQLILETSVVGAKAFDDESPALSSALYAWRNHATMLTKDPFDVFRVDDIRHFYSARATRVRFILTNRDPRAILVSKHKLRPGRYYVSCDEWQGYYEHFRYARKGTDTTVVEFERLVRCPQTVQAQLQEFIGWTSHLPFDRFHEALPKEFKTANLNGVRSLEPEAIDRWRGPQHHERIREVLRELPELPRILVEMGYESNADWVRSYR